MPNAVKLLNYIQPYNNYITFFSELNSDYKVGDKVFILGGNYDNTIYTDKNNILFNPFHKYAKGYEILKIEDTSNAITLNIEHNNVFLTNEDAYLSSIIFKSGDFNSGVFQQGIFQGNFNNNANLPDAEFKSGIVIDGNYRYGNITNKYLSNKNGLKQSLVNNKITKPTDNNSYNIEIFNDNNNGLEYSYFVSGDFGKVYSNYHTMSIYNNVIEIDYIPYDLKMFYDNNKTLQIKIFSDNNYKVYDIDKYEDNKIFIKHTLTYTTGEYDIKLFNETGYFKIELYSKFNINSGIFTNANIYGGVFNKSNICGGNVYWTEFKNGKISSTINNVNWYYGIFNTGVFEDSKWLDGIWLNGTYRGNHNYPIIDINIFNNSFEIIINSNYNFFNVNDNIFISNINNIDGTILPIYSDNYNNINMGYFKIIDIVNDTVANQTYLKFNDTINQISNINYSNIRISPSFINKGVVKNINWQSGCLNTSKYLITELNYIQNNKISINKININKGDFVNISNLYVNRRLNIDNLTGILNMPNVTQTNRETIYKESFKYNLQVVDILDTHIILEFETLPNITTLDNSYSFESEIVDFTKDELYEQYLYPLCIDNFNITKGKVKDAIINNVSSDNDNKEIVFEKSYIRKGTITNSNIVGGILEDITINNSIITNTNTTDTICINAELNNNEWERGILRNGKHYSGNIINGGIDNIEFKGGYYTNGKGVYQNDKLEVIYIDKNGYVYLDQPSHYQQNYNVIFTGFDNYSNPFNNQMFTVREVNDSILKIDYVRRDTPYNLYFINNNPVLSIDKIVGYLIKDDKYIVCDNKTIFIVQNKEVTYIRLDNITHLSYANIFNQQQIFDRFYVVNNNDIIIYDLNGNHIRTIQNNIDILDISICSFTFNKFINTIFVATVDGIYFADDNTELKKINDTKAIRIKAIRNYNNTLIDLFVKKTNNTLTYSTMFFDDNNYSTITNSEKTKTIYDFKDFDVKYSNDVMEIIVQSYNLQTYHFNKIDFSLITQTQSNTQYVKYSYDNEIYILSTDTSVLNNFVVYGKAYLTARILNNTTIEENAHFNYLGDKDTAHLVNSSYKGDFIGTWDAPLYHDNYVKTKFSKFLDGNFNGLFYDGFFLGGNFIENSIYNAGHFISNSNNITFNGIIDSDVRFDMLNVQYNNKQLHINYNCLKTNGKDYLSIINKNNIVKGSYITLPTLFKNFEIKVDEIRFNNILVNNDREIVLKLKYDTNQLVDNIIELFRNGIFISDDKYPDYFFNYTIPKHVMYYDNYYYITIISKFPYFDTNQLYIPDNFKISLKKYTIVKEVSDFFMTIDCFVPDSADTKSFLNEFYLKENVDFINNNVIIPGYSQIFKNSFERYNYPVNIKTDSLHNLYVANIIDDSKIEATNELIAHDNIIYNSHIFSSNNGYLENNIILSGKIDNTCNNCIVLNLDDKGFPHGNTEIIGNFNGDYKKILDYSIDNDYLWIQIDSIMNNIDKYRYISLRGFKGKYAKLLGHNYSNVFRIEEIQNDFIKILNPFRFYSNFNTEQLNLHKQSMKLKNRDGYDIRIGDTSIKNFANNEFLSDIIYQENVENDWYQIEDGGARSWNITNTTLRISTSSSSNLGWSKQLRQNYKFFKDVEYKITINIVQVGGTPTHPSNPIPVDLKFRLFNDDNIQIIDQTDLLTGIHEFVFIPDNNYTMFSLSKNLKGYSYIWIDSLNISSEMTLEDESAIFDYTYLSNSSFDGGKFNGDFNTIWNSGKFLNGNFNGEWFGSIPSYGYKGILNIESVIVDNIYENTIMLEPNYFLQNEYVYVKIEGYEPFYINVTTNNTILYKSNIRINGSFLIEIYKYRDVNNNLIKDFNINMHHNATIPEQLIFDYNFDNINNKVMSFNGIENIVMIDYINKARLDNINNEFTIDFWFFPTTNRPLLSFKDSNDANLTKQFVLNIRSNNASTGYLSFNTGASSDRRELGIVTYNQWNHISIVNVNNILFKKLNNDTTYTEFHNSFIFSNQYDICTLGRRFNEPDYFLGKLDEFRIWNKDMRLIIPNLKDVKIVNKYNENLTAYYSFDDNIENTNIYPDVNNKFITNHNSNFLLENDNALSNKNLILEIKFMAEELSNITGYKKILTIEDIKDTGDGITPNIYKYYFEILLLFVNSNTFKIYIRETEILNDNYLNHITTETTKILHINTYNRIFVNDREIYVNDEKILDYKPYKYNNFKFTYNTVLNIGKYQIANTIIDDSFTGIIDYINVFEDKRYVDDYYVTRILTNESFTDDDTTPSNFNIPIFDENTFNNTNYVYSIDNNYSAPLNDVEYDTDTLSTALPSNDWLVDDGFVTLNTDKLPENDTSNKYTKDYILTIDAESNNDNSIELTNMQNFLLFNKHLDNNDQVKLHITANGYLFFENNIVVGEIRDEMTRHNIIDYADIKNDTFYNMTNRTEAIMFNTIIDVHSLSGGYVKYKQTDDDFVIKFYGKSSNMKRTYKGSGSETEYNNYVYSYENTEVDYSFFAIRIDKINSNILFYIRRIGESDNQKYLGIKRSDGHVATIKDNNKINFYKTPKTDYVDADITLRPTYNGDKDYVIGYLSDNADVISSNKQEYILFTPRFKYNTMESFVNSVMINDYDVDVYGIKTYRGIVSNSFNFVEDNTINIDLYYLSDTGLIPYDPNNYINPLYELSNVYNKDNILNVHNTSYFYNGNYNSNIWREGVFENGVIDNENFIWKYGIKNGGSINGGYNLNQHFYWLGGFHSGNDTSMVNNIIWQRGEYNGGVWNRGQFFALDLDNVYDIDYSYWNKGIWYSKNLDTKKLNIENLFKNGVNGTFNTGDFDDWGFDVLDDNYNYSNKDNYQTTKKLCINTNLSFVDTTNTQYDGRNILLSSDYILVEKNTEYTITSKLSFRGIGSDPITNTNTGISIEANGETSEIINKVLISHDVYYTYIKQNNDNVYTEVRNNIYNLELRHTFNTGNNTRIKIDFKGFGNYYYFGTFVGGSPTYIKNYVMIDDVVINGQVIDINTLNPDKLVSHNSVWHGGHWVSDSEVGYTYESDIYQYFIVANNKSLYLPRVNSMFLGGLWLRGEFDGGIIANTFWHSLDIVKNNTSIYENNIEYDYDQTASTFLRGKMINSIWNGGIVQDSIDKMETIFGDLTNNQIFYGNRNTIKDFTWSNNFTFFDTENTYLNKTILGRDYLDNYYEDDYYNNNLFENYDIIAKRRVSEQYNENGIASVFWKRGVFQNGLFQFSHFDALDLNNIRQTICSPLIEDNLSIFNGVFYNSKFENGLFIASASNNDYPLLNTEPNSIFYKSQWIKGYWKADGIIANNQTLNDTLLVNVDITNAIFSRSIWNCGIFEGGRFDLSMWLSGASSQTQLKLPDDNIIDVTVGDVNIKDFANSDFTDNTIYTTIVNDNWYQINDGGANNWNITSNQLRMSTGSSSNLGWSKQLRQNYNFYNNIEYNININIKTIGGTPTQNSTPIPITLRFKFYNNDTDFVTIDRTFNNIGTYDVLFTLNSNYNHFSVSMNLLGYAYVYIDTMTISSQMQLNYGYVYNIGDRTDNISSNYTLGTVSDTLEYLPLENPGMRYVGDVDNFASIFINGRCTGSIWHGGIFHRGYFLHRNFNINELDYYGNLITNENNYQLGIFMRGLWLSGYFSYYNDKHIKDGADLNNNAHLYNNPFKDDLIIDNKGRRCLLYSINSNSVDSNDNIFGMSLNNYNTYITESNTINNKHNFATIYCRKREKLSRTNPSLFRNYLNIFSGVFVNGMLYQNNNISNYLSDTNKMIFTLYSILGNKYMDTRNNMAIVNNVNNDQFLITQIIIDNNNNTFNIPFNLSPIVNNGTNIWQRFIDNNSLYSNIFNKGVTNRNDITLYNIWRYNTNDYTVSDNFGDSTLTNNLPSTSTIDDIVIKNSIAQGDGMKYHKDEIEGEPKYDGTIGFNETN